MMDISILYNYLVSYKISVLATIFVILTSIVLKNVYKNHKYKKAIKKNMLEKTDRKVHLFNKLKGMKKPFENMSKFCTMNGDEISSTIHSKDAEAVDILESYQANALMKNEEFNFIADVIYDADVQALLLDDSKSDQLTLLGWPICVQDCLDIHKYDCARGLISQSNNPATDDCLAVKAVKYAGGLVFLLTKTLPEFYSFSSGKKETETAAITTGSSLGGLGTDICGSNRIGPYFSGLVGFKPTSGRVSLSGVSPIYRAQTRLVQESIGPIARRVDEVVAIFRTLISQYVFQMDAAIPPLEFNEKLYSNDSPMRIGWYCNLEGESLCVPAVVRCIEHVRSALEIKGHILVKFEMPNFKYRISDAFCKIIFGDGGQAIKKLLNKEPLDCTIRSILFLIRIPKFIRQMLAYIIGIFNPRLGHKLQCFNEVSVYEIRELAHELEEYRQQVLSAMKNENIECLICPVLPIVAAETQLNYFKMMEISCYSIIYNILNFPAGTVPVDVVNEKDLVNLKDEYPIDSYLSAEIRSNQLGSINKPVGIQCVSLPWRDEACLRLMEMVQD